MLEIIRDLGILAQVGAETQVVLDRERGEDLASLGHLRNAGGHARMR